MNVIEAPNTVLVEERPLIFLAGSIEGGRATFWQEELIHALHAHPCTLLNPRRKDWDSTWDTTPRNPEFVKQVEWELSGIEHADLVVYYFDPGTRSPITLLELGLALGMKKPVLLACGEGFYRKGNIDITTSRHGVTVHPSLEALIRELHAFLTTYHSGETP